MKLQTPLEIAGCETRFNYRTRTLLLGSCFAQGMGSRMRDCWMDVVVNPFGVLFNPCSIADSLKLLGDCSHFTEDDVLDTPCGYCSMHHHTSFAHLYKDKFLLNANKKLDEAREFYRQSECIIVTLGTAFIYTYKPTGQVAANCLKLPQKDFERRMISAAEVFESLAPFIRQSPERQWIFTVSPVRHIADGMHQNQLSKAALLTGVDLLCDTFDNVHYFPAYEIVMDELRDYRFYAEDMVHPSVQTQDYVFDRFLEYYLDDEGMKLRDWMQKIIQMYHHEILKPGTREALSFETRREMELTNFLKEIGKEPFEFELLNWINNI